MIQNKWIYYTSPTKVYRSSLAFLYGLYDRPSAHECRPVRGERGHVRSFVEKTFNILFLAGVPLVILIE